MVSIRTHFPSVPQKWPEPLESQAEFAVGSNRRLWRVGFIWWGLREIPNGTPVFQSWWSMMIYCVYSSLLIEKRQLTGVRFSSFGGVKAPLNRTLHTGMFTLESFSETCGPYPAISSYTWDPRWDHPMKTRSIRLWIFSQGPGEDFKLFSGQPDKLNTWVLALCGGHLCWIYQGFWLFLRVWEMLEFVKGWDEENIQA